MPANISSMLYVGEKPWHGLGKAYETSPQTSKEIIEGAGLDWETAYTPMYSKLHDYVPSYNVIYRTDREGQKGILGVVNMPEKNINIVQNTDTFESLQSLFGKDVETETAAALGNGEKVFGCFKIKDQYKLIEDEIEHYLVVVNEHLKPDGKVTILNTPIRVVCQNTLSSALSNTLAKYRVQCSVETSKSQAVADFVKGNVLRSHKALEKAAQTSLHQKLTKESLGIFMDEMFPYLEGSTHDLANERMSMVRETFLTQCMNADDLQNYKGTMWQLENALLDFTQHYYTIGTQAVDMEKRMLASMSTDFRVGKYQRIKKQLIA